MAHTVLQLPNELVGPPQPLFGLWSGSGFGQGEADDHVNIKKEESQDPKRSDRRTREDRDESNTVLDYMFNILWRTTKDFGKSSIPVTSDQYRHSRHSHLQRGGPNRLVLHFEQPDQSQVTSKAGATGDPHVLPEEYRSQWCSCHTHGPKVH